MLLRFKLYPQLSLQDTVRPKHLVGRFDANRGLDVMDIATDRASYIYSHATRARGRHNLFAY